MTLPPCTIHAEELISPWFKPRTVFTVTSPILILYQRAFYPSLNKNTALKTYQFIRFASQIIEQTLQYNYPLRVDLFLED